MSKLNTLNPQQDSGIKALLIYDDFPSAVKASAALHHSAHYANAGVRWNIRPWRVEMLKFPPTAEEALTEALDAHLIVFAGPRARSLPFWLQDWLEHWAKCRRIQDAALAVFCEGSDDALSGTATPELSRFAADHGLNFAFDRSKSNRSSAWARDMDHLAGSTTTRQTLPGNRDQSAGRDF
jgi:hypothetical protein